MVDICDKEVTERLKSGKLFYLVTDAWTWRLTKTSGAEIRGFTSKKEAVHCFNDNKKDNDGTSGQLLKVIPAEQRWEVLKEYDRGE